MPFTEKQSCVGPHWVRDDEMVFIAHYEEILGHHREFWAIYRVVERKPKGRDPWTVDNRNVGTAYSMADAKAIGEQIEVEIR